MPVRPNGRAPAGGAGAAGHLLEVSDLRVEFRTRRGVVRAVNGVSYSLDERETLAILGESGSGKTVSALAIMGVIDRPGIITSGAVRFRGRDLLALPARERRSVRGSQIAMVFQDALTALNPVLSVGWQIAELYRVHRGASRRAGFAKAVELMDRVHIPSARRRVHDYPHQFSGGMRQRVMIAMALALEPAVVIADEPATALDVTVQAQVMELLGQLRRETGMGLILITHDLGVVAEVADRVAVMYAGRIVETGPVRALFHRSAHPYTQGLLASVPRLDRNGGRLTPIAGAPPSLMHPPDGCAFHPRCPHRREVCTTDVPSLYAVGGAVGGARPGVERASACHLWQEVLHGA